MRWEAQKLTEGTGPALLPLKGLVRSVRTPEFDGVTFHEVLCKSALNRVPKNSSMPFAWTVNPTRGCLHQCVYCLSPDTLVLMADGRQKPIGELTVGERIVGTRLEGKYRRYVETTVQATWRTRKRAYRLTLRDGTAIVASGDHRFLTPRGWKHVVPIPRSEGQRPYLTANNSLMGFGLGSKTMDCTEPRGGLAYRRGYLAGMIRGDGMMIDRTYLRKQSSKPYRVTHFRLALTDFEALRRSERYLEQEGVTTRRRPYGGVVPGRRPVEALYTSRRTDYVTICRTIRWPERPSEEWHRGFLAGIFDAEGSYSGGVLRISNSDDEILSRIVQALASLELPHVREPARASGVVTVRIPGGRAVHRRFFHQVAPAITRKVGIVGQAVKTSTDLGVATIEDLGTDDRMVDITTGTGDFIANGVVSHNCFARKTHEYLDLDSGADFDSQIVVKTNVAEVLRAELARPSWAREHVALGTNSDPYMRAEGRYQLMPGIIEALTDARTPFSILTKGPLLRRDLPLLERAAEQVNVDVGVSLAFMDDGLQQRVEPGTPRPAARLGLIRALAGAGLAPTVMAMPVLPWLTDSEEHLDALMGAVAEAGGAWVTVGALHLRPGAREWFLAWLEREFPELVPKYQVLYGRGSYASAEYRDWLAGRVRRLRRRHGFTKQAARDRAPGDGRDAGAGARWALRNDPAEVTGARAGEAEPAGPGLAGLGMQPALF
ncbi:MAG TPA: intein-containing Rv2578c family radical SAM protein [Candidatus Ruania gallistercoris]|uniref:Intein-containing Rv2578c family radical SAM protein n=1 Tax=Candidatus Ruania gallistercoris TaxID=2838746 RepID=A0A9D2EF88_9MICO|nr:intein-containing Rv2578c family radical SAM protein [Candidatus Ruania gallistercoris]